MNSILVIDDDEGIRKSFLLTLEDTEYSVETASTGEEGLEKEKEKRYNLIYLDLRMPGMNGIETLRAIREIDRNVPVYIITAFHKEFFEQLKAARDEGVVFEIIQKPVGMSQIEKITNGVLKGPVSDD